MPPARELWLASKLWFLLLGVRASLKVLRYDRTRRWLSTLGSTPRRRLVARDLGADRAARLLERVSAFVPDGKHCLARALVLEGVLLRRGHPAKIEFGVARSKSKGLEAHAWLLSGDRILLGGRERGRFTALTGPRPEGAADTSRPS